MTPFDKMEAESFLPQTERKTGSLDGDVPVCQPARQRQGKTTLRVVALAAISSLLLGSLFHVPVRHCIHKVGNSLDPRPKSIEQRVSKILTDTPLIGSYKRYPLSVA